MNPGAPINPGIISPVISESSSIPTITPNTPTIGNNPLSPFFKNTVDGSTQTVLDGVTVSKMVESVSVIKDSLNKSDSDAVIDLVNSRISKITD
jgi:hypothetical protein